MSTPMERLRQLVGSNGWDYCILWKLSEDQRFLEFMDCCCSGSECNIINNIENGITIGEELMFSCRDGMFEHPTTKTCQILSHFPSSQPLDGINMEILISNQPRWLNFSNVSDLSVNDESLGTKILIPIPGGLVELYAAKQVSEDLNVIDYVMAQCNTLVDQGQMSNSTNVDPSFSVNMNMINELQSDNTNPISTINHSIEFLPQFNYTPENNNINNNDDNNNNDEGFQGFDELIQQPNNNVNDIHGLENSENGLFQGDEKAGSSLPKQEISRADSVSDSDQLDDDDDPKYRRRVTKGPQSKNLVAERKRRKKLNERLYNLRSLVPNISKLDRASILGDAITYVKELQKEANDLQEELERNSDDEGIVHHHHHHHHQPHNNLSADLSNVNDPLFRPDYDVEKSNNGFLVGDSESLRSNYDLDRVTTAGANDNKAQQMEVQVEVGQLEGNEFHVKVFGEQKRGGFVRLMEALNALGLDITNVNMTSCISLVSYVFIVKKRDSENVHAEYLRDSLLEATRSNQAVFWSSENGNGIDHRLHNHHFEPFHDHFHHLGS